MLSLFTVEFDDPIQKCHFSRQVLHTERYALGVNELVARFAEGKCRVGNTLCTKHSDGFFRPTFYSHLMDNIERPLLSVNQIP